jgi:hypothetical protein
MQSWGWIIPTQLCRAGTTNIGDAWDDFREGLGLSAPVLRNHLLGGGARDDDHHRRSNAGFCNRQLFS